MPNKEIGEFAGMLQAGDAVNIDSDGRLEIYATSEHEAAAGKSEFIGMRVLGNETAKDKADVNRKFVMKVYELNGSPDVNTTLYEREDAHGRAKEELKKIRMEEDQRMLGEQLSGVLKYAILAGNIDVANVMMQSSAKLSRDDLYGAVYQAAQDGFSDMVNFVVKNEETLREPKKDDDIRLLVQPVSNGGYTLRQVSKFFKEYPEIKKDFDAVLKRNIEQPKKNPPHLKKGAKDPHKPNSKSLHKNKHHRR